MTRAREFHARAARQALTHAARSVVFGAPGFPAKPVLHEAALAASPGARVCYADADPDVTAIREALHEDPGRIAVCTASLRDPAGLLACPEVAELPGPLHVQAQLAMHFWAPRQARGLIRDYGRLLPSGSVLLATWALPSAAPAGRDLAERAAAVLGACVYRHRPETAAGWLDDAGLSVMPPGPADVRGWGLGWSERARSRAPVRVMGIIARKR